ncbi:MAG TPA: PQQ-binding-like beta-propeller repeat protein [Streptosporangiaceae bacterium]|nr:PQQ-binding-like beta-propeller repeat protein [Streptosporangiaceae bacterium]
MRSRLALRTAGWVAGLTAALWMTAGGPAGAISFSHARSSPGAGSWTVYHGDPAGRGVAASAARVDATSRAWTSPALDGEIYGEPLVSAARVYVATENNTVYALSAATGAVAWSRHLATPVPSGSLPCGDIAPTVGITGTPVIDPARGEIFVVADEVVQGRPAHVLTGLNTSTGRVEMTRDVDPAGADTTALLQRTGLTLAGGRVVFGFGGNDGDCATYRGRVVAVPEAGGAPSMFTVDAKPGQSQGAVWMGGAAPAVDSRGDVWVSVGNGSVYNASRGYDDSDSVLDLSPSMRLLQYFAPASWASDNSRDLDMSAEPVLLHGGQVLLAGKSPTAYLLNGAHLGGIGGQLASLSSACDGDIDGGAAVAGRTVYLPCVSGIVAVTAATSRPGLRLLWRSGTGGGPPIVAGGLVWTISQAGWLYGLDPATGKVRQQAAIGAVANHFPTASVGAGLLLAPAANRVVAFRATGGPGVPSSPASPASAGPASPGSPAQASPLGQAGGPAPGGGGLSGGAIAGLVAGGAVLLGGAGWLLWRRARPRAS